MTDEELVRVSCVIVSFHRPVPLARLVLALMHPHVEIVVVNVEDDDDVREAAGASAFPLPGNPGFAAAVNAGARRATAPVIVFMNDDLETDAGTVLHLAETIFDGSADVALPAVVDAAGNREKTIAALPTPASLAKEWLLLPDKPNGLSGLVNGVQKWRSPEVPERIEAGSATLVATSAELLRSTPLPETYFLYWEESEWFWHLREQGATVIYDPSARVRHSGGRDDVRRAKSRLMARNAVRCVRRTQGRPRAAMAWPVVVAWNVRLVLFDGLRRLMGSGPAAQRLPARAAGLRAALAAWREI